jgi:hypothetical protein
MIPTSKILKSFLYLWAAAVLWIYIGSLVNFHQHKIWGRPLLPQLLYAKRDKEQSLDFSKLLKSGIPTDISFDNHLLFFGRSASEVPECDYFISSTTGFTTAETILVRRFIFSDGLRAPPLS